MTRRWKSATARARLPEWLLWFALLIGSVFVLGFFTGSALGAPPVLHLGPPAGAHGVACSRVTLRDYTSTPPRVLVLERCYRSSRTEPE